MSTARRILGFFRVAGATSERLAVAVLAMYLASELPMVRAAHFILYVADQAISTRFYANVLGRAPRLDVPGMTEIELLGGSILGLMPSAGIKRLLGEAIPDPDTAAGIPRAELYLVVDDATVFFQRALAAGARVLSPIEPRGWGHDAGYALDPDGHVLAFAHVTPKA